MPIYDNDPNPDQSNGRPGIKKVADDAAMMELLDGLGDIIEGEDAVMNGVSAMKQGMAQYNGESKKEGCNTCLLDH